MPAPNLDFINFNQETHDRVALISAGTYRKRLHHLQTDNHSFFYRPDALLDTRLMVSKH